MAAAATAAAAAAASAESQRPYVLMMMVGNSENISKTLTPVRYISLEEAQQLSISTGQNVYIQKIQHPAQVMETLRKENKSLNYMQSLHLQELNALKAQIKVLDEQLAYFKKRVVN